MVFTRNQLLSGNSPARTVRYRAQSLRNSCHTRSQQESPPLYNAACHPVKFSILSSGDDLPCGLARQLSSISSPPPALPFAAFPLSVWQLSPALEILGVAQPGSVCPSLLLR